MQPISYAKLVAQNALLGSVVPELRAVIIDLDVEKNRFSVFFFYDGEINDALFDLASVAITEMSADLPEYELDDHIVQLDFPEKLPSQGQLVYLRKE